MLTSHAYQAPHDHFSQGGLYNQEGTDASKSQVEGSTTKIMNPSPTCGDPFGESVHSGSSTGEGVGQAGGSHSPSHHFAADDEFETMGINIPSSALEDQQQPGHQGGGYNNYHQHQHQMMQQHQQQQQWQHHHHQMQQQQQWHHQGQYMNPNGYGHAYEQYGYGDYGQMYAQGGRSGNPQSASQDMNFSNGSVVGMGGPSPVGSHNTPSPQGAHTDDAALGGSVGDDHIRNNNILKRPSPGSAVPGVTGNTGSVAPGANNMHPGVLQHGHQAVVHQMVHLHPHHHGTMASPYHLHGHPQHQIPPPGMPVAKKPKVSKRKKKRDPNEPNKPVSAYALFFRDSQASIKQANPNAAFGDVSKIVASLWDALDPDSKAAYKKRTENAKKEYLKKLAAYRASLVSKGGDSGIGYGYYGYSDVMQNNGLRPSHQYIGTNVTNAVTNAAAGGVGQSSSSYMGQPIPPRPPIQQGQPGAMVSSHMHHGHTTSGAYMMQGQMQNGGMMGGQSPHSVHSHGGGAGVAPHSSMSQHSPMDNNSHLHNQQGGSNSIGGGGGPIHSPAGGSTSSGSSSGQTPLNTPTSASMSSLSPNGCVSSHVNKSSQQGTPSSGAVASHGKQCGRPGCTNLVQRTPDGWAEEFCSNECVVGQCKEVYTNWSSGSNTAGNNGNGGPPPNPYSSPTAPPVK